MALLYAQYLVGKAAKVLLVCLGLYARHVHLVRCRIEHLAPPNLRFASPVRSATHHGFVDIGISIEAVIFRSAFCDTRPYFTVALIVSLGIRATTA